MTATERRTVLSFDPWGERDATYVLLAARFVTPRKAHTCAICIGPVLPGAEVLTRREADNGKVKTFYFCEACCLAIARRYESDDAMVHLYARYDLGRQHVEVAP